MNKTTNNITLSELALQVESLQIIHIFQEDIIESLERNIMQQYQSIQNLQNQIRLLSEYLKILKEEGGDIKNTEDKIPPPHY